ncbi:MAG: hypothetical protein JST25_13175 [Actinobacteria bacterium]|nr:hypothetical protein [Actinomycetota bacterium]
MTSNEASAALILSLLESLEPPEGEDWVSMAAVLDPMDSPFSPVSRAAVYVYDADGVSGVGSLDIMALDPSLRTYLESLYQPGEAWPTRLLIQISRVTGDYEITFEDSDTSRWKITPANLETIHDELRPSV